MVSDCESISGAVLDEAHQQLFLGCPAENSVEVRALADFHLIRSLTVPSPSSLDLSADGNTLAVATTSEHVLFFNTVSLHKTGEMVAPFGSPVGSFLFAANGNGLLRTTSSDTVGDGITAYWEQATNSFINVAGPMPAGGTTVYLTNGPMARSGDHKTFVLSQNAYGQPPQILDANTGAVLSTVYSLSSGPILVNQDASVYAYCSSQLELLNGSLQELYLDPLGCASAVFSSDGKTLYRDVVSQDGLSSYTQAMNLGDFSVRSTSNSWNLVPHIAPTAARSNWMAADSSGMVYGTSPNKDFVAVDTMAQATPNIAAQPHQPEIWMVDAAGSAKGGDVIQLSCKYCSVSALSLGGQPLTAFAYETSNTPAESIMVIKTPPHTAGAVDLVANTTSGNITFTKAFQYGTTQTYPFATSPTYLLFDRFRNRLYASHGNQVEVIDTAAGTLLAPLVPVGGKLANSAFEGLSLSPDGARLYVADNGANKVHVLKLDSPGTGESFNLSQVLPGNPNGVNRVFETASGRVLISTPNLWLLDPAKGTGTEVVGGSYAVQSIESGEKVLVTAFDAGSGESRMGLWDDAASTLVPSATPANCVEQAGTEDGTAFACGGSTPGASNFSESILDQNMRWLGVFYEGGFIPPQGTPSLQFDPTGARLYLAGNTSGASGGYPIPQQGEVGVYDLHTWQYSTVVFPEIFVTSYAPIGQHLFAVDASGNNMFGVTASGITQMTFTQAPLSIGNLQPAEGVPAGGETLQMRGLGFDPSSAVKIGGVNAATTYVDSNTLSVVCPALAGGYYDVVVTNSDGRSYTWSDGFHALASTPAPIINGFSPAAVPVVATNESGPLPFTVLGAYFQDNDVVKLNDVPVVTTFVNANQLQVAVPGELSTATGQVTVQVISPDSGGSNITTLSLVNPVPVISATNAVMTLVQGGGDQWLMFQGTNLLNSSVAEWNGVPLTSNYSVGLLSAAVPAALVASAGSASLTVVNPAPGGGQSNSLSVDISPAHPLVRFPASVDLGTQVLGLTAYSQLMSPNLGTATYVLSSWKSSDPQFSIATGGCSPSLPPGQVCQLTFQYTPTAVGAASATLTITDNSANGSQVVALKGSGIAPPTPTITGAKFIGLDSGDAEFQANLQVGGPSVPWTAWFEYGTDPALNTFNTSATWSGQGDVSQTQLLRNLSAATKYAARLAVKTIGGTGRSNILQAQTTVAPPVQLASDSSTMAASQPGTYRQRLYVSDPLSTAGRTITLGCSGAPTGVTCSVNPGTFTTGSATSPTELDLNVGANWVKGTYSLTVVATAPGTETAYLPITLMLTPEGTTTTLSAPGSVVYGGSVSLTTNIFPPTATGSVTFKNGSSTLGTSTLASGTATLTLAATTANGLAVGSNSITAVYGGDTYNLSSTSTSSVLMVTTNTTTALSASPSSIPLGSSSSTQGFTATVVATGGSPIGTVTFTVGSVVVGAAPVNNGLATLSGVLPTTANGFTMGSDTVKATYTPTSGSGFVASSGTQSLPVTAPAYTVTPSATSVSLSKGGSLSVAVTLASTTFADTTSWTATTSSSLISVTPASGTATLSANGSSTATLTITASRSAANHAPKLPWTGCLMAFGVLLRGVPLARRRKRLVAVLITALAVATLGLLVSCGGSGGSNSTPPVSPRNYTVTVSGTGGVSSTIVVTVQ